MIAYEKKLVQLQYPSPHINRHMSPLWKDISKLSSLCELGCNMIIGNEANTLFWLDR
jgi:hypothetical protein